MIALIHIEKTGGITLNYILRNSFGSKHCDAQTIDLDLKEISIKDFNLIKKIYPNIESIAGHKVKPFSKFTDSELSYFTFLRDPIARTLSHYQFQVQKMGIETPYIDWITDEHYRNYQTKKIAQIANANQAINIISKKNIFVGLTEKFDDSINMFNDKIGFLLNTEYKKKNKALDNSIRDSILADDYLMTITKEANLEDIKLYNHVLSVTWEEQLRKFDSSRDNSLKVAKYKSNLYYRNLFYMPIVKLYRFFN